MNEVTHPTPVLIADDDHLSREMLASLLRGRGYHNIGFARDGVQTAHILDEPHYQQALVFLDIHMPGMDGLQALASARAGRSDAFIVLVSADSALDKVLAALSGGAKGFVVKPYTPRKIFDMIDKFEAAAQATPATASASV